MKMLLTAVAMMIASPAPAQTAPATELASHAAHPTQATAGIHAGHGAPSKNPHAGHAMMDCSKKGAAGVMACCAKMKATGKKMACRDKPATSGAGSDPHVGHKMKPKN